jgi:hypothetical protein
MYEDVGPSRYTLPDGTENLEVDDTPFGKDGDHCPWCGADWRQPHSEYCDRRDPNWNDPDYPRVVD